MKGPDEVERELGSHEGMPVDEATVRLIAADIAARLKDAFEPGPRDDWAFDVVFSATWQHYAVSRECVGWLMTSAGRGWCGKCGWSISGWLADAGEPRSGVFALYALGRIGEAFSIAQSFAVAYAQYHYGDQVTNVRIDGKGGIVGWVKAKPLHSITFVHTVDV